MKKSEGIRDAVCDAFREYLEVLLLSPEKRGAYGGNLAALITVIAPKYGLDPVIHRSKDWYQDFGLVHAETFRTTFAALVALVKSAQGEGKPVRLLCHCVPRRCHAADLAAQVELALLAPPPAPWAAKELHTSCPFAPRRGQRRYQLKSGRCPLR
jgi:hypothetical protein